MNHIYSLIWNPTAQTYTPAPESARSRTKGRYRKLALALAISAACGVQAAPQGGVVVDGSAGITRAGDTTHIDQSSQAVTIHWDSFDIGANETVNFYQPDATSLALNRVLTGDGTQIHGQLNANGRVFILDANGVLFGEKAQVNVGSLVASTLDLHSSGDGHFAFSGDGAPAAVINRGTISVADGGAVALLGGQVSNQGIVRARLGHIALAAGNDITLDFAGDGLLHVQVNQGAAQALAANGGLLQAHGGSVLMTAHASDALLQTVVNNQGVIEARTLEERDGKILLLGGFDGGTVQVGGVLDASAPDGGNGGFIDTSGAIVKIQADARISAAAPEGEAGTWLLDPTDLEISYDPQGASDNNSHVHTQVLQNSLIGGTNVTLETQAAGTQDGNITVVDPIVWSGNATLTLEAHNNIVFNDYIHAPGGGLTLSAGNNITTGAEGHINVGTFMLSAGNWSQVSGNLPVFIARDFRFDSDNSSFIRALGGSGTSGSPWQLTDIYGLQGLATTLGAHAVLANDIDATGTAGWNSGAGFSPVGSALESFTGSLDGDGFVIDGLTINRAGQDYVGLFGSLGMGSSVSNLGLERASIVGADQTGALVGVGLGNIDGVFSSGSVTGGSYTGGLIGIQPAGNTNASYSSATVAGSQYVGGLAGRFQGTLVSNSYATGSVTGDIDVGGLVGNLYAGALSNSYATGSVEGQDNVGGLAGVNASPSTISLSYASGRVTSAGAATGGLVGTNAGAVTGSFWDTFTTNQTDGAGVGSTVGITAVNGEWNNGQNAYNQATYTGFDFVNTWFIAEGFSRPMLKAFLSSDGSIANLYQLQGMAANLSGDYFLTRHIDASATIASVASGNFSDVWGGRGFSPVGNLADIFTGSLDGQGFVIDGLTIDRPTQDYVGLFGHTQGASLSNIGLENVDITGGSFFTGALVGLNDVGSSITASYATGAVEGSEVVGGLVGRNSGSITASYSTGTVAGNSLMGGLVGQNLTTGNITSSYATGAVQGDSFIGGLVGYNGGNITQSYASGWVDEDNIATAVGGLVGQNDGAISDSYWDQDTTVQFDGVGMGDDAGANAVTGLDWGGMLSAYSQSNYTGFDFDNVWFIAEGGTRPMLRAFLSTDSSISNLYQLQGMAADLNGDYFLIGNIDASAATSTMAPGSHSDVWGGLGFAPVGNEDDPFTGSLDGNGFVIDGLTINREWGGQVGLFGRTSGATLTGVALENVDITGNIETGALAGQIGGFTTVSQSYATGVVRGDQVVGGLVGVNLGEITQSHATATVTGNESIGGLVGVNGLSIIQSYATGEVEGNNYVGGLVGVNGGIPGVSGDIGQSYATGAVSGGSQIGGLVGFNGGNGYITQSYATGAVDATGIAGGLVGENDPENTIFITASYWHTSANPGLDGVGSGDGAGATGLTTTEFTQIDSFDAWGDDINADGSGSTADVVWRIYEGHSAPLLRAFLTDIDVIAYDAEKVYDGAAFDGHHDINGTTGNGVRYGSNYAEFLAAFGENGTPYGASDDLGSADLRYTGDSQGAVNAGTYEIGVDGLHSHQQGYNILFTPGELEVTPASLVVDITMGVNNATKVYGNADPTFTWNLVSGTLAPGDQATGIFSRTAGENVGTYTITATPTGDFANNYNVTVNNGVLTITPRPVTITVDDASKIYGDLDPDFAWAITNGTLAFSDSLSGSLVREPGENVGHYAISANLSGALASGNYAVTLVDGTLTITPRDIVIDISHLDKIYGDADPEFTWAVTQGGLVDGDELTGTLTRVAGENVGNYAISGVVDGDLANGNYTYTINNGLLTISPRPLVLTADSLAKVYGEDDPALTWQITSGTLVGDDTLVVGIRRDDGSNVGIYAIRLNADVEDNSNYALTLVDGQLQITPAPLTVRANDISSYWDLLPPFTATVEGLVNGDTEAGVLGNSLVVTSNLTLPLPGDYVLTPSATQIGNNYTLNFVEGVLTLLSSNPGGNYIDALTATQLPAREALGREDRANIFEGRPLLDGSEDGVLLQVLDGGVALDAEQLSAWGIRLPETVLFPVNSSVVGQQYFADLRQLVEQLKRYPQVELLVEGHTCNTGSLELNQRLSQSRADAVAQVLQTMGLDNGRIRALGYDYQRPVADNRTPEGRGLNRRAEIREDEGR